jgi:hypothetical protein
MRRFFITAQLYFLTRTTFSKAPELPRTAPLCVDRLG